MTVASTSLRSAPTAITWSGSTTKYSARPRCSLAQPTIRVPSSASPTTSCSGNPGSPVWSMKYSLRRPRNSGRSEPQIPPARNFTSCCPSSGSGRGTSTRESCPGAVNAYAHTGRRLHVVRRLDLHVRRGATEDGARDALGVEHRELRFGTCDRQQDAEPAYPELDVGIVAGRRRRQPLAEPVELILGRRIAFELELLDDAIVHGR